MQLKYDWKILTPESHRNYSYLFRFVVWPLNNSNEEMIERKQKQFWQSLINWTVGKKSPKFFVNSSKILLIWKIVSWIEWSWTLDIAIYFWKVHTFVILHIPFSFYLVIYDSVKIKIWKHKLSSNTRDSIYIVLTLINPII